MTQKRKYSYMGGRESRNKGKRAEYQVRDYFRTLGYKADRVPSSGAAPGFKGDVKVVKGTEDYLIEVKSRRESFKSIYNFMSQDLRFAGQSCKRFVYKDACVSLSFDFLDLLVKDTLHEILLEPKRTLGKILNMQKLLKGCHFLVIKDNNKPLIFIKYHA